MLSGLVPVALAAFAALLPSVHAAADGPPTSNPNNYPPYTPGTYNLDPKWNINAKPTTRVYNWEVGYTFGAPDGFPRALRVVNGQFPGPLVEVNEGDTVIVNLKNNLDIGTTIHWHGINQNGTNWSDGTTGVTQCPIPPGYTFKYEFTVTEQFGTYWWHAHAGDTLEDGIFGPLVVHSPLDPHQYVKDYDYEQLLIIGDWMHNSSDIIFDGLRSAPGWLSASTSPHSAPNSDAVLINGMGQYNGTAINPEITYVAPPYNEIQVYPNKRYRFRTINYASHGFLWVMFDQHPLTVISADGTAVQPVTVEYFQMGPAERYDFIINTNQGKAGSTFWGRFTQCMLSVQWIQPFYNPDHRAILKYLPTTTPIPAAQPTKASTQVLPTTSGWSSLDLDTETTCHDMDLSLLKPITTYKNAPVVPKKVLAHKVWSVFGVVIKTYFNANVVGHFLWDYNITNQITPYGPVIQDVLAGREVNKTLHAWTTFDTIGAADIGLSNRDHNTEHPWHFHGRSFWVVAQGPGELTEEMYQGLTFNTNNPIRRDTFIIPRLTWAVIRFVTDVPGVWALHCHVGWHSSAGKTAAVIVQPDAIRQQAKSYPSQMDDICQEKYWPPGVTPLTETP